MPNRAYIIPLRNDLNGVGLQLRDLQPVAGQKSSTYDGEHQDFYVKWSYDYPGVTVNHTVGGVETYASGSLNTAPLAAYSVVDTNGDMANDAAVAAHSEYGLAAYLQERCANQAHNMLVAADAVDAAARIMGMAGNGWPISQALVNGVINAAVAAGASGHAVNYDILTSGLVRSFGAIEDLLRIMSGEPYMLPNNTIIGTNALVFQTQAARAILVAAAVAAGNTQYDVVGHFLTVGEAGYRPMPQVVDTGALRASITAGQLSRLVLDHTIAIKNPNFAYSAAEVTAFKPRAFSYHSYPAVAVPTTGAMLTLQVYTDDGVRIAPVI